MTHVIPAIRQFLLGDDGPTAVEYAVMLALILVACITVVTTLGQTTSGTFSRVSSAVTGS
jgi:pilus assembly protein Flp/PilA